MLEEVVFEGITKKRKNPIINYVGWTLLAVVCVVFVFIGYDFNQSFLGTTGAAAEVNGDAISVKTFSELVERMENQQGAGGDADDQRRMRENAINILVNQELVYQNSKKINVFVSDSEVAHTLINEIDAFKDNGQFSRTRYQQYLRAVRQSEEEFENFIRKSLMQQKMLKIVGHVAESIPMFAEIDKKIEKAKINISFLAFNKFNSATVSVPSETAVQDFLAANEAKVRKDYDDNLKTTYTEKEQVKARHILIKFDEAAESNKAAAKEKIDGIAKELTVQNFSELATKHSQDPGSAARGGDLGFFPRGRMVKSFEEVAFTAEIGKISEPVESKFGYHIILVDEKKAEQVRPYDDVKKEIAANLVRDEQFAALEAKVRAALKSKDMDTVEKLAAENNVRWKDTGLYSITEDYVPGVGKIQPFIDGAQELTAEKPLSEDLIPYLNNRYILKLKEAKFDDGQNKPGQDQLSFLQKLMERQRSNMVMQSWIDSLKKNAKIKVNTQLIR